MKEINNRYFVCPLLPKDSVQTLNGSIAANNFCYNLISGNLFTEILPYLPVGSIDQAKLHYEDNRVKLFCNAEWRGRLLLRKFAFVSENARMFKQIKTNSSVWFYNLPYTIIFLYVLLRVFKPSVKCNLIMLDFTPQRKGLQAFSDAVEITCINKMHGMIKLADSPLFTVENSVCLPGVVPANGLRYPQVATVKKEYLISGALGDNIAMLSMLLEVFSWLPDLTLHITGNAPDKDLVEKYTQKFGNIIYHGMVPYEEYLHILHEIPFLLSTRNPACPENQCNFPSKIIEALLHNRIVISTLHYRQLDGVRYLEVSSDKERLKVDLQKISAMPEAELLLYANQAETVKERFSCEVWNKAIIKIENNHQTQCRH